MNSPAFSNFRELMDRWDDAVKLFKESDLCLFFKKDGVIYGAAEASRITFARIKNPETKEDEDWKKEATFTAYDLEDSQGQEKKLVSFSHSDIDKIKLISQEQAEKELDKKGKKLPAITDNDEDKTYGEK
jgi:hypothetical protein